MSKRQFKVQASSSLVASGSAFGGFGAPFSGTLLSYLGEQPDISSITDANVVVAFKNLLKKDSTTKAKGLEDLKTYVQAHPYEQDGGVEESILDAWVKVFPRISIDNSRRVRELSHVVQYELLKSTRKRMEKYIPLVVGSWLAGTFDRDRPVSKAAKDGITSFLDTEEKILSLWRKCQRQIMEYAHNALEETPQTLSDERTVTADDSQAKYERVIGASLSLVSHLLSKLDATETTKCQAEYGRFFSNKKSPWTFIASNDSFVRRTTAQLLLISLDKQPQAIEANLRIISEAFIGEGLNTSQKGSALIFVQALTKFTSRNPTAWTTEYKGKRRPMSRLRHFVEKGSQNGPPEFWHMLGLMILKLPPEILPSDSDRRDEFLKSLRDGISSRDEPRLNVSVAWDCYLTVLKHLLNSSQNDEIGNAFQTDILPMIEHFLRSTAERTSWYIGNNIDVIGSVFGLCTSLHHLGFMASLETAWVRLSEELLQNMRISLPEQSKDFAKSQTAVAAEGHRWFELQATTFKSLKEAELPDEARMSFLETMQNTCNSIISGTVDVLVARRGKPYGCAATLEAALQLTPDLVDFSPSSKSSLYAFLKTKLASLLFSPSSAHLMGLLVTYRGLPNNERTFEEIWGAALDTVLSSEAEIKRILAVEALISCPSVSNLAQSHTNLQQYLLNTIPQVLKGDSEAISLFENTLMYESMDSHTADQVLQIIINKLDVNDSDFDNALHAVELFCQKKTYLLLHEDKTTLLLMTRLLTITESPDPGISSRASAIKSLLADTGARNAEVGKMQAPIMAIIRNNLDTAGPQSLNVNTLVQQVEAMMGRSENRAKLDLFPRVDHWSAELHAFVNKSPDLSIAMTSTLGGCVYLVTSVEAQMLSKIQRDANGYSTPFRMALYTLKLLLHLDYSNILTVDEQAEILHLICLTTELANDELSLLIENSLWVSLADPEVDAEVQDAIASSRALLRELMNRSQNWRNDSGLECDIGSKLVMGLLNSSKGTSPSSFLAAQALGTILSNLVEAHGWTTAGGEEWLSSLNVLKTSTPDIFSAVAILGGLGDCLESSKLVNNLCNKLISDIAGAPVTDEKTLGTLVLLNACLAVFETGTLPAAQNRLVFALKQITSWLEQVEAFNPCYAAEILKCLSLLTPSMKDIYGTYWETMISFCIECWQNTTRSSSLDAHLPVVYYSIRLINILKGIQDPNDDLEEALVTSAKGISESLLQIVKLPRRKESQPCRIVDDLLCREVIKIPISDLGEITELYPLVASDFRPIQTAGFNMLHRAIPAAQQQVSIDVLLDKKDALLPEELLSLLLDAPNSRDWADEDFVRFPSGIRCYLLSWNLVFDSYNNASYKVRNDYTEQLKSENALSPLLALIFDILGHSVGRPLNLEKSRFHSEQIRLYDIKNAEAEPDEWNLQWLLIHLYYLSLKYLPALTKNWWIDCKSKQTRIAVQSWTEKYFSPLVITDTLEEVIAWAAEQEAPADDEKKLIVKLNNKSREVYAGYEVDEMQMQIVIRLPAAYPLENVKVDSINRVAVSEKKWQSWLMVTQGVITFSNGSITDGLSIFRKNVTGTLKGQTECAICYSIVSSDNKMPDKRCQTCKNLFHSSCLFKWFASSNQSTCPLCRNPFNYGSDVASRARRRGGPEQ